MDINGHRAMGPPNMVSKLTLVFFFLWGGGTVSQNMIMTDLLAK